MLANKINYGIRRDPQLSGALESLRTEGSRFNQLFQAGTPYAEPFRSLASGIRGPNDALGTVLAAVNTAESRICGDAQLCRDELQRVLFSSRAAA